MTRKILSALCATTLAATFAVTGAMPLNAAPIVSADSGRSGVLNVQFDGRRDGPGDWRNGQRDWKGGPREFRRDGNRSYYNGYRGYRERRPGYRQYNGFWFPAAAFIAGALITGSIKADRGRANAHVTWCYNRYQSYRAWDNSYNPGRDRPRRQCNSPYN